MMVLDTDTVNKLFVATVKAGAEVDSVIIETRNGVRPPAGKYATIFWKQISPLNNVLSDATHSETEKEYIESRLGACLCTVQFTVIGDGALNTTLALNSFLASENRQFDLYNLIGISNIGDVLDLSTVMGGKYQERACFDFSFYVEFGSRYAMDYFTVGSITVFFNNEKIEVIQ